MVPKKLAMKAKQLFNLQIQSTQANWKPRVHKNQVMKAKPFVQPTNPEYTGKLEAKGTQESGHEGEAAVQPENPVHTPVVGSVTETETQAIDYPIEVITDDSKYVDEEVVEQEGQKVAKKSRKFTKPLMVSRLVSQLLYQVGY